MTFYILVFAGLAVLAVFAFLTIRSSRRKGLRELGRETHTGAGHVRAPTPMHPAKQRHEPARPEPGPSGGGFHKDGLGAKVKALFRGGPGDETWAQLEDLLIKADVGPAGSSDLVGRIRKGLTNGADPVALLREEIVAVLGPDEPLDLSERRPGVVLVVGVNGSGKTTTIGRLAKRLAGEGMTVSLAAADTYRAAAGEQLEVWARRAGAHVVGQDRGADPGAVAFDAVKSAAARGADVLIVDTAGRLHTKTPLMEELGKIRRVIEKAGAQVDETLLVLDAQTGQNGIAQARAFTEAVDVTGVVLTKTDGSAKGGIVLAVREELGLPVRFVGVGEGADDLRPFEAATFAERLLSG
ncbi:MAG: signal recognition particle-docking protein FtsY [Actinomycetota bacterium]|nr:signal recognition particle-docking protein FtsY [Actinomycetota bacterium]MDH5224157.1 signal recognition particle-docking protein FtsY [Actinomycetota bacterium]MDH5312259.1 signal recognition particle-docking protein FtsY [Actinomycetota bacterium]